MNYAYGQFTPQHYQAMQHGLECYNAGLYWECHEDLEDLWADDQQDNARLIYWAIIQVATSLHHFVRSNPVGAWGMLFKAKQKLELAESKQVETDFLQESLKWDEFKRLVRAIPKTDNEAQFEELKQFKFPLI